jgi:enoyl-CoA hydratase/carnithine racemase
MTAPGARPYDAIVVSTADGITTITLNRPERRNAIGPVMMNELLYALEDATLDASVTSIVLTGAGKTFCAGGDFAEMAGGAPPSALPHKGDFKDLLLALWHTTKPVVARVNGHAMGGGLGLVAACTFSVASTEAKLGTPEVDVGLFPFMIYAVLERVMTRKRLLEMILGGERLTAEDAVAAGLVNRAVAPDALDAAVAHYTALVAKRSPSTVRLGLEALRDTEAMTMEAKLPVLAERLARCLATEDAREGLTAFMQKREPKWTGR